MGFKKGNQLWRGALESRQENQRKLEAFLVHLANDGMDRYAEIMDQLASGQEESKADTQYMDRLEGWREHVSHKLARTEVTGKDGEPLFQPLNDKQKKELAKLWANG